MGVWGQALVEDDVTISTIATTWLLEADHLLSIVRPLEPVLARKLVDLLGSSRSVRVLLWLGSLAVFAVDPVQDRGEDLGRQVRQFEVSISDLDHRHSPSTQHPTRRLAQSWSDHP